MTDTLAAAAAAIDGGEWCTALTALDADPGTRDTAEGLELLASAAYGAGEFERAVGAWEALHRVCLTAGDETEAARAAAMVAMYLMMDTGLMAPVRGWLARAERLARPHADAPAHAVIAMTRTYERFMCGDMDTAREQAALAVELGERLGVQPAEVIGRVAAARVEIYDGNIEVGLAGLDEVGALLMSGAVDPLTTGMMYCELICAAQGLALHQRAHEWTDVMERWRHGAAFGGINGRCRVHRAEMLRMTGPCDVAEEEALGACDELRPWMRREFGWPLAELGMIRLRKGDLAGAEEAFLAAHEHAWSPHPGLALLRLEQGDVESARALIHDAIAHPFDVPSKERPPFGELRLAPLLDAPVSIAAAAGDVATAQAATADLASIAATYPSPSLLASVALARARTALLDGDVEQAASAATASINGWTDVGAPFEAAVARLVLGDALERAGRSEAARLERTAARTSFEQFGAGRWAARAGGLVDGTSARRRGDVGRRGVFRRDGDQRTITFAGTSTTTRDLKGYRYLDRLLTNPDREFHVLDLVSVEAGTLPTSTSRDEDMGLHVLDGGLPAIDDEAREAYRRRLAEVDDDIEQARRDNDMGRVALAERDRDYLIAELRRAVGLGERHRTTGSTAERARTSVARSLRYALGRLRDQHPELAVHLDRSIRTGTYCSYAPDPAVAVEWEI